MLLINITVSSVTAVETLHVKIVRRDVTRTACTLYCRHKFSDEQQIRQLGQLSPICDKYKMRRTFLPSF
jgi:hypothetical protein